MKGKFHKNKQKINKANKKLKNNIKNEKRKKK